MIYTGRDYQHEAVASTWKHIEAGSRGTLLAMATGVGKTVVAGMLATTMESLLFIVDREELAFQSQEKLQEITGRQVALECGPEYKAFKTNPTAKFVVAMSQSLIRRLSAYRPDRFRYIMEDECFPAGTMVGSVPIETIKVADMVDSYNHQTRKVEQRKVLRVSSRRSSGLVRVSTNIGESIICTPDHPFYAAKTMDPDYAPACSLRHGNMILRNRDGECYWVYMECVDAIPDGDDMEVFNLEVEHNHNYFANGYLVHNCHHSVAATRTTIRNHFSGSRATIGLSATPKRADGKAAGEVYDTVAFKMDIVEATDLGWLTPFRSRVLSCNEMDLRQVKLNCGEFNAAALRVQLEKQAVVERIARQTVAIADGRQTVIFGKTVEQSKMIDRFLRSIGERSTHVDGKLPRFARRDRLARFSNGDHQFICNCNLIEEGVDVPGIEVVAMASPCRSTPRFIQRCGRGLRPVISLHQATPAERRQAIRDSRKPWCTIIDFIGQMDQHCSSMCFSGDLLGGEFDDEERKVAIRLASGQETPDIKSIMAEAKEIVAKRRAKLTPAQEKEEAVKRYQKAGRVQEQTWCVTTTFCPYSVLRIDKKTADKEVSKEDSYGKSYSGSETYLRACNLTPQEIRTLSSKEIVFLARLLRKRSETHSSFAQCRQIHARGYDASNLTKSQGNTLMDRIRGAGYVRPVEDGPNELYEESRAAKSEPVTKIQNFTFV